MTDAQEKAFSQIKEIMCEHFEGGAFAVLAKMEGDDHGKEEVGVGWHGGKCLAGGLFLYGSDMARGLIDTPPRDIE